MITMSKTDNILDKFFNHLHTYGDVCLKILPAIFIAEALQRIYRLLHEYLYFPNNYLPRDRFRTIAQRAFTCHAKTKTLFVIWAFTAALNTSITSRFPLPPLIYFAFMPLYWLHSATRMNHSTLDYVYMVRERHGLDYAEGMASNYYHGYLKLTLPSHQDHLGLRERIELYKNRHSVEFAVDRLVILIPDSLFVKGKIESKHLEKQDSLETVMKQRAGVNRPFKNDVYRFKFENRFYYIVLEGATPILSFFNAMNFPLSSTWQMCEMKREILLKFAKSLKRLLQEWPETKNEAEIIFYNTHSDDGREQDVGDVLIAHMELWQREREQSKIR